MTIVILHGLYMHGLVMLPLSQRLQELGYKTRIISYNTLSIDEKKLFNDIDAALEEEGNILLGHSLGGLMIKRYLASRAPSSKKISHVITLASPIKGASIAEKVQIMGLGVFLGNSVDHGLVLHEDQWEFPQLLGSITGTVPIGIRSLLLRDDQATDGTVTVEETKIKGMADHVETTTSHTGIILSTQAIRQIDHFIKNDHFISNSAQI
ncbi:triacylglycerol lipase [Vibrio sp. JC009]|uniref:esterase/lipase family protein n=1 Tax=Vibrio sp. JC009 TaxID=2912314 RepID=UPI0023B0F334|nr:triacylglycerol lipase [Vibrio sp. JC009]WED24780.1 triacylglycerol lipase [Vibrio sp. JC009]